VKFRVFAIFLNFSGNFANIVLIIAKFSRKSKDSFKFPEKCRKNNSFFYKYSYCSEHISGSAKCPDSGASSGRKGVVRKYMILLFPTGAEGLSSIAAESQFGGWPCLKVGDGNFLLMPPPATKWHCHSFGPRRCLQSTNRPPQATGCASPSLRLCRRLDFVDANILSTPIFCRR
jgi:hypothetical protein